MKIPQEIYGQNKLRDAMIIKMYMDGFTPEEIITMRELKINARRIQDILWKNRALIKIDKQWEETKQVHRIKRHIKKSDKSKKDVYDWETLLDSKITPKKIEHSGEVKGDNRVIIIREISGNTDQAGRLPGQVSIVRS